MLRMLRRRRIKSNMKEFFLQISAEKKEKFMEIHERRMKWVLNPFTRTTFPTYQKKKDFFIIKMKER
jgi:hypothetical protein